jgi:transposase, IS5 family
MDTILSLTLQARQAASVGGLRQVRRVTASIRREMRRRAAVEPVIGHLKAEHRMGRNYLKGPEGDRINAVLAAAGYNFGLLLRWLAELLRACIMALTDASHAQTV